jgi:hypothetical protein
MDQLRNVSNILTTEPVVIRMKITDEVKVNAVLDAVMQSCVVEKMRVLDRYLSIIKEWMSGYQGEARLFVTFKSDIEYQVDEMGDKVNRLIERCREVAGLIDCHEVVDWTKTTYVIQEFKWTLGTNRFAMIEVVHSMVNNDYLLNEGSLLAEDDIIESISAMRLGADPEKPSTSTPSTGDQAPLCIAPDVMSCGSTARAVVNVMINGVNLRALVDTGASLSLAPRRLISALSIQPKKTNFSALSASGHNIPIIAIGEASVRLAGSDVETSISFTEDSMFGPNKKYDIILGCDVFEQLPPITFDFRSRLLIHAGVAVELDAKPSYQWEEIPVRAVEDFHWT